MLLRNLFEGRDSSLTYTPKILKGKVERLTISLEKQKSSAFTKIAKQYLILDEQLEKLQTARDELNAETKTKILSYFDAEDEIYTRVVETVSMTASMSKLAVPSPKVNHEKVLEELLKLMPELNEKVAELTTIFTTIGSPKSPSLTVKINADKINEGLDSIIQKFKSFAAKIFSWGKKYDAKLEKIKSMMQPVTEAARQVPTGTFGEKSVADKGMNPNAFGYDWRNPNHNPSGKRPKAKTPDKAEDLKKFPILDPEFGTRFFNVDIVDLMKDEYSENGWNKMSELDQIKAQLAFIQPPPRNVKNYDHEKAEALLHKKALAIQDKISRG